MFGLKMLKNLTPEQIALMGVVAATGGLAAPAAAGAAATGAATGAAATGAATAGAAAVPASAGILGEIKGYLDEANKVIKPVGKALGAAKTAQGLLAPDTPQMQAPAPQFGGGGNPVFMGLLQEQQAQSQARMQEEMQRRQAQQKLLEMMGGR
jgi:hypothetical protein